MKVENTVEVPSRKEVTPLRTAADKSFIQVLPSHVVVHEQGHDDGVHNRDSGGLSGSEEARVDAT